MDSKNNDIDTTGKRNISEIFKEYQHRLKNFIARRVDSKEDGEDILQNVFYQLVKADSLMQPIEAMTPWLYSVTRNQIIDWNRKKKEEALPAMWGYEDGDMSFMETMEVVLEDVASSPETEYIRSLVWSELDVALGELPEEQSNVFRLTELEGISFKEISESTEIPVNTLISRKRYAVLHLRGRLKELYDDLRDV